MAFPSKTDENLYSQLPQRLARSHPVGGGKLLHRSILLSYLECPRLKVNFVKSQWILFLGTVFGSAQMRAAVTPKHALAKQRLAASFATGPLKSFQRMLGLMASASPVLQLGLLHVRPLQYWLKLRVPSDAWRHGRLQNQGEPSLRDSPGPLEMSSVDGTGHALGNGLQKEGDFDRCFQYGLGSSVCPVLSKVVLKPRHGYVPKDSVQNTGHFALCASSLRWGPGAEFTLPH